MEISTLTASAVSCGPQVLGCFVLLDHALYMYVWIYVCFEEWMYVCMHGHIHQQAGENLEKNLRASKLVHTFLLTCWWVFYL